MTTKAEKLFGVCGDATWLAVAIFGVLASGFRVVQRHDWACLLFGAFALAVCAQMINDIARTIRPTKGADQEAEGT
jgi:hypothetical protein